MNREQKAVAIAEIAARIDESSAVFAVDYRGISVSQAAELRSRLRDADATFTVVKNSLTERAADQVGADTLKEFLTGPTALTFVRGDVATAAKAIADYARATQLLPLKGGLMDGGVLGAEQIRAISRLPSREALYGQLVGVVASPVTGLVRTLNALVSGLAVALGQVQEKKESGEVPAGTPPVADGPAEEAPAAAEATEEAPAAAETTEEAPAAAEATEEAAPAAPEQDAEEAATGQTPEAPSGEPASGGDEAEPPVVDAAGEATIEAPTDDASPTAPPEPSPDEEPPPEEALAEDTADAPPAGEATTDKAAADSPAEDSPTKGEAETGVAEPPAEEALAEDTADAPPAGEAEPSHEEANQAEASAKGGTESADENPTKED